MTNIYDDLQLLHSVLPAFRKLAHHFASAQDEDAARARRKFGSRRPLFDWKVQDLDDLGIVLRNVLDKTTDKSTGSDLDQEVSNVRTTTTILMKNLETNVTSRIPLGTSGNILKCLHYPRLKFLGRCGPEFRLADLKKKINYKAKSSAELKQMNEATRQCIIALVLFASRKALNTNIASDAKDRSNTVPKWLLGEIEVVGEIKDSATLHRPQPAGAENFEAADFLNPPHLSIVALGWLLLSLEAGCYVDSNNHQSATKKIYAELGNGFRLHFQAAYACIRCDFENRMDFRNVFFVKELYETIVFPLEEALYSTFFDLSPPDPVVEEKEMALNGPRKDSMMTKGLQRDCEIEPYPTLMDPSNRNRLEYGTILFHMMKLTDYRAKQADDWFADLKKLVHPLLRNTPSPGEADRVKVAVLDTGAELPETFFLEHAQSPIRASRSWIDKRAGRDGDPTAGYVDNDGHGTHAVGLLIDVAPCADVYVARVLESRHETQKEHRADIINQRISRAIRYAVDVWKVNIISISFGFQEGVECIGDAIRYAATKNVLVFAAGSNDGGSGKLAWPASAAPVIAVHASTGYGNKYYGNTTPQAWEDNFAILGVEVESWWPERLHSEGRVRKSGTSCATPIAAGIAAIIMQLLCQAEHLSPAQRSTYRQRLGRKNCMRAVFQKMVNGKRDGYRFLTPWFFLKTTHSSRTTMVDNILDGLPE
ncbi:hypothetical protein MBLNU459_g4260t2 [Dothideomycetes sp. NU459]